MSTVDDVKQRCADWLQTHIFDRLDALERRLVNVVNLTGEEADAAKDARVRLTDLTTIHKARLHDLTLQLVVKRDQGSPGAHYRIDVDRVLAGPVTVTMGEISITANLVRPI